MSYECYECYDLCGFIVECEQACSTWILDCDESTVEIIRSNIMYYKL